MILAIFTIIYFSLAFMIKGGSGWRFFKNWDRLSQKNGFFKILLDGRWFSSLMVLAYALIFTSNGTSLTPSFNDINWTTSLFITLMWLAAILPSLGEEYQAIAGTGMYIKSSWHKENGSVEVFDKFYGEKKLIQRGVLMGAAMTLATSYDAFIWFSLLYLPISWVCLIGGRKYGRKISEKLGFENSRGLSPIDFVGWFSAEMFTGAVIFGVPMAMWLGLF